jgi:hypothetical protein
MANIFAAITAVLLALSAYLAVQNQKAFEDEVEKSELAKQRLDMNRKQLVNLREERDDVIATRRDTEATQVEKKQVQEELTIAKDNFTQKVNAAKRELEEYDQRVAELEKAKDLQEQNRELIERIKLMRSDVADLETTVAGNESELEQVLTNLIQVKEETEGTIRNYKRIAGSFAKQTSYFEEARIGAIYPAWGFVTLDSGHMDGVVANSTLAVVRGDEIVANLRVQAVESQRASAEIVPGSLAAETALMIGDRVVPASSNDAPDVNEADRSDDAGSTPVPAPEIPSEPEAEEEIDFGF